MLLTYPDVSWRPVATASYVGVTAPACASQQSRPRHGPLPGCVPHLGLLPSGVTPLRWVLHHFGGGVMLPNWCMTCRIQPRYCPAVLVLIGRLRCRLEARPGRGPAGASGFHRNPAAASYRSLHTARPGRGPAGALHAARTCAARRAPRAQRKRGPAPADPRLIRSYS